MTPFPTHPLIEKSSHRKPSTHPPISQALNSSSRTSTSHPGPSSSYQTVPIPRKRQVRTSSCLFFGTPSSEREAKGQRFINQRDSGSSTKVPDPAAALVASIKLRCVSEEWVPTFHPDDYCMMSNVKVMAKTRSVIDSTVSSTR